MEEEWRPIPGMAGYDASSEGRIRVCDRLIKREGPRKDYVLPGRILAQHHHRKDHLYLRFRFLGPPMRKVFVNRAVCTAFHGPAPTAKHHAAHRDGDELNNRSANLVWATPKENSDHMEGHGTRAKGARNGRAKLTEDRVRIIRQEHRSGATVRELCERHQISDRPMRCLLASKTWAHVIEPAPPA